MRGMCVCIICSNNYCVVHWLHVCLYHNRPENSIEAETEHLFLDIKSLAQCLAHYRLQKEMASEIMSVTSISILESQGNFITAMCYNKKKHCSKSQKTRFHRLARWSYIQSWKNHDPLKIRQLQQNRMSRCRIRKLRSEFYHSRYITLGVVDSSLWSTYLSQGTLF